MNDGGTTGVAPGLSIAEIGAHEPGLLDGLCELLLDSVAHGASIGFLASLTRCEAKAYWNEVIASLGPCMRLWIARVDGTIAGTVQIAPCLKPNGRHRGDLQKLLVHSRCRQRGIASSLMNVAERAAGEAGLTLLVLDTIRGCDAERLYRRLDWQRVGEVPDYAGTPDGVLHPTVYYYKFIGH